MSKILMLATFAFALAAAPAAVKLADGGSERANLADSGSERANLADSGAERLNLAAGEFRSEKLASRAIAFSVLA